MKRGLLLLVILLFVNQVNGLILLDELDQDVYNIGENIDVSGYILEDDDNWGRFQLDLECQEKIPLLIKAVNIKSGERYDFSEDLPISLNNIGNCKVLASFIVNTVVINQAITNNFFITSDLDGNFTIKESLVQLGKDIVIIGEINKKSQEGIDGVGLVYFLLNGEIYFIKNIEIVEGKFELVHESSDNLPGEYLVNIEVNDIYGNRGVFESVLGFTLVSEISVFTEVNKKSLLPGSTVTVFGEANTILLEDIQEGFATIYFNDGQFKTKLKRNGQYDHRLDIPKNINTGEHKIRVVVDDKFGNRGEGETLINIEAVPTNLELEKIEGTFRPGDLISIKPFLYDQAGDLMDETVNVKIVDPNREEIFSDSINSGSVIEFEFPEMSAPGVWRIDGRTSGVESKLELFVGELFALDFKLDNQTLIVENIGNVKYKDPIEIKLKGAGVESNVVKKTSLDPGENLRVDLGREVKTGIYDIEVLDKKFDNVYIPGLGKKSLRFVYWLGLIVLIGLVLYVLLFRTRRRIIKKIREKKSLERMKKVGKDVVDDVDKIKKEFRDNILKQIEERDRKITKKLKFDFKEAKDKGKGFLKLGKDSGYSKSSSYEDREKKKGDKKDGGLFSMFD